MAMLLLEQSNVNPNSADNDGQTPLMWIYKPHLVKLLQKRLAVNSQTIVDSNEKTFSPPTNLSGSFNIYRGITKNTTEKPFSPSSNPPGSFNIYRGITESTTDNNRNQYSNCRDKRPVPQVLQNLLLRKKGEKHTKKPTLRDK